MPIILLLCGTALIFTGRSLIQGRAGIPPAPWLPLELLLAAGPFFGLWTSSSESPTVVSAIWLFIGGTCFLICRRIVHEYDVRQQAHQDLQASREQKSIQVWKDWQMSIETPICDDEDIKKTSDMAIARRDRVIGRHHGPHEVSV